MAVTMTTVPAKDNGSSKPDPTTYNELVSRATLRDIRLVGTKLDFKPEAAEAAGEEWEFERSDQLDSWSCEKTRGVLSGVHTFTASLVRRRKKVLSVQCSYLTSYNLSDTCDDEAGRHYLARVGRLAAYPYFRSMFAALTQQSGVMLPPLPVITDGPRWVTPPKSPVPVPAAIAPPAPKPKRIRSKSQDPSSR